MAKLYDVVCTTGKYQKDGDTKYLSKNVGSMIETKNGPMLLLDASFNPAGCERGEDGKVWLKLFTPRDDRGNRGGDDGQIPF
jgi:single-strand DNA-binding protein